MKIGQKIRELRQQAGISQETLARALVTTPQAISRWETGSTAPDIMMLPALASYFEVSIDTLFSYGVSNAQKDMEEFFDQYYTMLNQSEYEAQKLLNDMLRRYPGQETLRLLQCFHLKSPHQIVAKIDLCRKLMKSQNPTVRTEATAVLANCYYKSGDETNVRNTLALLPECDTTKLTLEATFYTGAEVMCSAQRQKSSSLANLFEMMLRISELYQEMNQQQYARQTLLTAKAILEALKEDAPFQFPKGNRSASTWERFSEEYYEVIEQRLNVI